MNPELYFDYIFNNPQSMIVGEMTASQLPGRQNGGAADAYRHILLSAEFTRDYGAQTAFEVLIDHEREPQSGADNGLDMWNNSIGMSIGSYVRDNGGSWGDVVRLARSVMVSTFTGSDYKEIETWKVYSADDGIKRAYDYYLASGGDLAFDDFASGFNREYSFRSSGAVIYLDGGKLIVGSAAMTSPGNWAVNPKILVNGQWVELSIDQAAFPGPAWLSGRSFIYEAGNDAPVLIFDANQCFLAGTQVSMWDGTKKPIEQVKAGDIVVSYDKDGNLKPGRVKRAMTNRAKQILDVHGLMVTPGHATLCGDGRFDGQHVPILDILRSDGALVREDGSKIRAGTGCRLGTIGDRMITAIIGDQQPDGLVRITEVGQIRAGTRFIKADGEDVSVLDMILNSGGLLTEDGMIQTSTNGPTMPFRWTFTSSLPKPEDYVLQRSATHLRDIYQANEWESVRPSMPIPAGGEVGATNSKHPVLVAAAPVNVPLALRNRPDALQMSRKYRRAAEAKARRKTDGYH